MPKRLNAFQLESLLSKAGFELISQKGSHKKWRNISTGKQVTVPYHQGQDLPIGTLINIIKGSGLDREYFGF